MPKTYSNAERWEFYQYALTHNQTQARKKFDIAKGTMTKIMKNPPEDPNPAPIITPTKPRKVYLPKPKVVVKVEMIEIPAKFEYALKMLVETGLKAYKNKHNKTSLWLKEQGEKILEVI